MAKVEELTVNISIEAISQKVIAEAVQSIHRDHGLRINNISFAWIDKINGDSTIVSCDMDSSVNIDFKPTPPQPDA